jgi:hypothetical protein
MTLFGKRETEGLQERTSVLATTDLRRALFDYFRSGHLPRNLSEVGGFSMAFLPKMITDALLPRARDVGGLLLIASFASGCALSASKPATPPPHAFISYEAPKPGDKSLRFGVKDLIDIKGEVTSAGSEISVQACQTGKGRRGMFADRT